MKPIEVSSSSWWLIIKSKLQIINVGPKKAHFKLACKNNFFVIWYHCDVLICLILFVSSIFTSCTQNEKRNKALNPRQKENDLSHTHVNISSSLLN